MKEHLNAQSRELSIDELDNAAGGMPVCGLPPVVVAAVAGAAFRAFIGGLLRMF